MKKRKINWTNSSVLALARGGDPVAEIENAARRLVFRAKEQGWEGPPFNPILIAQMLNIEVEANSNIADAQISETPQGAKLEFNPRQPRERVRFSIAHEVAHLFFPDWNEHVRHRRQGTRFDDSWQLEMLCNIAASELVLPMGSLGPVTTVPPIEDLMVRRREYDVSVEAYLLRLVNISREPTGVFFASPIAQEEGQRRYRVDYFVGSPTAPGVNVTGMLVPDDSVVFSCTAIGFTDSAIESWVADTNTKIECVGLPAYPGDRFPRVAGLVRFTAAREDRQLIRIVHGDVLAPTGNGLKMICQLVNDRASRWGGGVARNMAERFPHAQREFINTFRSIPKEERLGNVIFTEAEPDLVIASLIAQQGFGKSLLPRIRYSKLATCLKLATSRAVDCGASVHMPRIGTGSAGGEWKTIEELIDNEMVRSGLSVTVYDRPPKREQIELF